MIEPVIRRKVLRPRSRPADQAPQSGLGRALPRALVRALSAGCGLTAEPGPMAERGVALAEGLDRLVEDGFVALLTGRDGGAAGLLVLDSGLFSALIEAMTLGRLGATAPAMPRRPTATDAALLGALIDRVLADLDRGLLEVGAAPEGWRMARAVGDQRLLGAILDEGGYRLAELSVELSAAGAAGSARRSGRLALLLPDPDRVQVPVPSAHAADRAPVAEPDAFSRGIEGAVQGAPAVLTAVLGRVALPLEQALALAVGQRLELPISALEEIELVGLDTRAYAAARLGQTRGMRAIRITVLADGGAGRLAPPGTPAFSEAGAAPVQRLAAAG
jgi:flagellar motor switch protein FliM